MTALLLLVPIAVSAQPVTVTVTLVSGERHAGQNLQHREGGEVSLRKSPTEQLRVPASDVAIIDFGGTSDIAISLGGSQQAVVLRNGTVIKGRVTELAHSSFEDTSTPYVVSIREEGGTSRRFAASEVARVYFRSTSTPEPPAGGGFVVSARQQWTSTGIIVRRGEMLTLRSTGQIRLSGNDDDIAAPSGAKSGRRAVAGAPIPDTLAGALIGRIGPNGRPFRVGDQTSIPMPGSGDLFLGVNDDYCGDNQGEFRVEITRASGPVRR
jgi:hypothetical protein